MRITITPYNLKTSELRKVTEKVVHNLTELDLECEYSECRLLICDQFFSNCKPEHFRNVLINFMQKIRIGGVLQINSFDIPRLSRELTKGNINVKGFNDFIFSEMQQCRSFGIDYETLLSYAESIENQLGLRFEKQVNFSNEPIVQVSMQRVAELSQSGGN